MTDETQQSTSAPAPAGASQSSDAPKPKPAQVPKPSAIPSPAALRPRPGQAPAAPAAPAHDRTAEIAEAKTFGRVGEDSTVYVKTSDGEREVGQYPDADEAQALEYFAKKYLDLADAVTLLEQRLAAGAAGATVAEAAGTQREALADAQVVGDLDALRARLDAVSEKAAEATAQQAQAHEESKAAGLQARIKVVEEAEAIADADPARVQWKQSSARMKELFEQWKQVQATTPRLPRSQDQQLWGRFSKARNRFDKARREFFSALDERNAEGKRIKQKLVTEAEAMSDSTDWRETAQQYRRLMDRWKAAPRAGRKDDDALWAKFRAAQDRFFAARNRANEEVEAEYGENLKVKEKLLAEAEALLPITDPVTAKEKLRVIQDRWEDAGKVPRADISRMEGGLRAVERALAEAEDAEWRRTNPEHQARTSGMLAQLDASIAELEAELEKAEAAGKDSDIAKAREALEARRAWRDQVARTAEEMQ